MKVLIAVNLLTSAAIAAMGVAAGAGLEAGRVGYGVFYLVLACVWFVIQSFILMMAYTQGEIDQMNKKRGRS